MPPFVHDRRRYDDKGNMEDDSFICLGFGFIGRGLRIIIEYQVIEHLLCIGTHAITI